MRRWKGDFSFEKITETTYLIMDRDWERSISDMIPERRLGNSLNLFLVVGRKVALIDTGMQITPKEKIFEYMKTVGLAKTDLSFIINTHAHGDHIGGNDYVQKISGAKIIAHPLMKNVVNIDIPAKEGDKIDLGEKVVLTVLETPGHIPESICLYHEREKTLFVGDLLQGVDEYMNAGWFGLITDAAGYEHSLRRLAAMDIKMLLPGHWKIVQSQDEVKMTLQDCLEKSDRIEQTLRDILQESKQKPSLDALTAEAVRRLETRPCFARGTVEAYMEKIEKGC